ncbi:hypothetical protein M3672_10965 [Microbacterium enclense]|uniref:hypothetical protein n=1 Tax=Microbacterium enclense TaxID=993073 RepID=UPI00203E8D20|nr:hypothetical protein [Microbacterium enclense]MCM3614952.1 hypothetical protein [Microbacterium enclense]
MTETQEWGWVLPIALVAVPAIIAVIGTAVGREARTPRPIRNIKQLSDALAQIPEGKARESLDGALAAYVETVSPDLVSSRKLNWANVALAVIMFLLTGGGVFLLAQWVTVSTGSGWNVVAWIITVLAALAAFIINLAAVSTIYTPPKPKNSQS